MGLPAKLSPERGRLMADRLRLALHHKDTGAHHRFTWRDSAFRRWQQFSWLVWRLSAMQRVNGRR